jgi:hypothetical protein
MTQNPNCQQPVLSLATPLTLHQETIAGKKSTEPTSGRGETANNRCKTKNRLLKSCPSPRLETSNNQYNKRHTRIDVMMKRFRRPRNGGGWEAPIYTDLTREATKNHIDGSHEDKAGPYGTNGLRLQKPLKPKQARTKSDAAGYF